VYLLFVHSSPPSSLPSVNERGRRMNERMLMEDDDGGEALMIVKSLLVEKLHDINQLDIPQSIRSRRQIAHIMENVVMGLSILDINESGVMLIERNALNYSNDVSMTTNDDGDEAFVIVKSLLLDKLHEIVQLDIPLSVRSNPKVKNILDNVATGLSLLHIQDDECMVIERGRQRESQQSMISSNLTLSIAVKNEDTRIINYDLKVDNQFRFNEKTQRACISISLVVLYELYGIIEKNDIMLNEDEWRIILKRAMFLHEKWCLKYPYKQSTSFPLVEEILTLEQCRPFVDVFGKETKEYGGISITSDIVGITTNDNPEGDLNKLFNDMKDIAFKENRIVCALIVLPHSISISVICRLVSLSKYSIIVFDSHGGGQSNNRQYCELLEFFSCRVITNYLIKKYNIRPLTNEIKRESGFYAQSDERILSEYGYSAKIFIK
jgi:hypothetical protein